MDTAKIIVGYRTRIIDSALFNELTPTFEPARNLKDPDKIKADLGEKMAIFMHEAKDQPYTGTFDEVMLSDLSGRHVERWNYEGAQKRGIPICIAARTWLLKHYPKAWEGDTHAFGPPKAIFIGFNPRLFLKMLGEECSLPHIAQPLPPRLWYSNSDHRDILEAVLPTDFKKTLTLPMVLKRRRPTAPDNAAKWDQQLKNWAGPGQHPDKDVWLATELATQLGFAVD